MTYTPPTLITLRGNVSLDLRDADNEAFTEPEVDSLINRGIVELNRLYPLMRVEDVDITDIDADGTVDRTYTVETTEISRAEVWREGAFRQSVPMFDGESNSGLDLWGTTLTVPTWLVLDATLDTIRLYGYADRDYLSADDDVAELDAEGEYAVRTYAQLMGYQRLQNDRALLQQWLKAPGNNEMSPNQLDSMVNTYVAQWERQRAHLRRIRR